MANLTKAHMGIYRAAIDAALATVAAAHNLPALKTAKGTYDPDAGSFSFKVEGMVAGGMSREASRYTTEQQFDAELPPLGFAFVSQGVEHTVAGMNTTGSKVLTACNGKQYLWKVAAIKSHFTRSKLLATKAAQS